MPGPSRVGTIDPLDTKTRAYVTEDLKEVAAGSAAAAFVFARSDLDRVRALREELGVGGDEAARVNAESAKRHLADAERRASEAEAEAAQLRDVVKANEKAAKSDKASDKAEA